MNERELIFSLMKCKLKFYNYDILKSDYLIFTITRRSINKFINHGVINEKLILNNIIILNNVYKEKTYEIFKILLNDERLKIINPFFIFLGLGKDLECNSHILDILKQFASENYIQNDFIYDP